MIEIDILLDMVGQISVKKQLAFYLRGYHATKVFPSTLICGQKGGGKSMMAVEIAKNLYEYDDEGNILYKADGITPKKKKLFEINASTIKNVAQFVNSILLPRQEEKCTFFFDESSEIPKSVTMALLTLLNPNSTHINTLVHDEYTLEINLKRHTFLFATSEPQAVFAPLRDRLVRYDLESYSNENLAQIIQKSTKEIDYEDGVLIDIASTVRQNPRQAVKRANEIKSYLGDNTFFGFVDWASLRDSLSINNLGLNRIEISLLKFMKAAPNGSSLTNLSAKLGISREAIQRDYEHFLLCNSLMEITPGCGRQITSHGLKYLKDLTEMETLKIP